MVAPVSAWGKAGAWALDAEEHEASLAVAGVKDDDDASSEASNQQEFPSLAAAAAATTSKKKKKKAQPISLAEFTTGKAVSHGAGARLPVSSSSKSLGFEEPLQLPTGPRERSAEEIERLSSRGFGYSSYGGPRGGRGPAAGDDSNPSRWGSSRDSDEPRRGGFGGSNLDLEPSRADETDDWGAAKRSVVPERRDRGTGGGFFDSQSRADESDSWISTKRAAPPLDGRRIGGGGGGGFFGAPRERGGGFDFNKEGSDVGGADSETWGRKKDLPDLEKWREDDKSNGGGCRPRLVLQPRSLPLPTMNCGEQLEEKEPAMEKKSKGSNPFGQARPREEVLAEKGLDWKTIDEKLETVKIRDAPPERPSYGKRGPGEDIGTRTSPENRTYWSWRKPNTDDVSQSSEDTVANSVPEN